MCDIWAVTFEDSWRTMEPLLGILASTGGVEGSTSNTGLPLGFLMTPWAWVLFHCRETQLSELFVNCLSHHRQVAVTVCVKAKAWG